MDAFYFMLNHLTSIPLQTVSIEDDGSHLVLQTRINGKHALLLIDTGASRTVFDQERILNFVKESVFLPHDKLSTGLGTNSMPTSTVKLDTFQLGDLKIKNFNAVLLDLQHVNGTYGKLGHDAIDGVLGNDVLAHYDAIINYKKLTLTLTVK